MTSVYKETGRTGAMACFRKRVAWRYSQAFERRQRLVTLERLLGESPAPPTEPRQPAEVESSTA
jgi:hypothetical protein